MEFHEGAVGVAQIDHDSRLTFRLNTGRLFLFGEGTQCHLDYVLFVANSGAVMIKLFELVS